MFDLIRDVFAATNDARARGYKPNRFSFNVKGGRCEACSGDGIRKIEMHFLSDVYVPCEVCGSKRYNRETLEVRYKGKNIYEVLEMTVDEALEFFAPLPRIAAKLQDFAGCRPRLRQARPALDHALRRRGAAHQTGHGAFPARPRAAPSTCWTSRPQACTWPTWKSSIRCLTASPGQGTRWWSSNTTSTSSRRRTYIIDMGPEGGDRGGTVIAEGTPEEVARCEESYTGMFLKKVLN